MSRQAKLDKIEKKMNELIQERREKALKFIDRQQEKTSKYRSQ
jgi:hypothetical protein